MSYSFRYSDIGVGYCYKLSFTVHMFDGDSLLVLRGPVEGEEPGQWTRLKGVG